MSNCVVDSSVVVKWVLRESDTPKAYSVIDDTHKRGGKLYVIDFAKYEVSNAIWSKYNRSLISRNAAEKALDSLDYFSFAVVPTQKLLKASFQIALNYHCSVYDAAFVATTLYLDCIGVTADVPLFNKCNQDIPQIQLLNNW